MKWVSLFVVLLSGPAWACLPVSDTADRQAALIAQLNAAETQREADQANSELWQIWLNAPDMRAQTILDTSLERLRFFDFDGAIEGFNALIDYCPDYAEGYNQRAYAYFLKEDYAAALPDIERAIERAPFHIGAHSGKALTLLALGRDFEGQQALREALKLNPWLSERHLLRELPGEEL